MSCDCKYIFIICSISLIVGRCVYGIDTTNQVYLFGELQQDLNISCPLTSANGPTWSIEADESNPDRQIIKQNEKYLIHKVKCTNCSSSSTFISKLQINFLTENDERTYACHRTDQVSIKFHLQLIVRISGVVLTSIDSIEAPTIAGQFDKPLTVTCSVTKSRPAPNIVVHVERPNKRPGLTRFHSIPAHYKRILQADGSYSTQSRFVAKQLHKEDDKAIIVCDTSLPDVNKLQHRVRVSKQLRVYYPPECGKASKPTLVAVNRSNEIVCPIVKSNPVPSIFKWNIGSLEVDGENRFARTIHVIPISLNDIRDVVCIASNEIGEAMPCRIPLALGGRPDPVQNCRYSYPSNHSLQIVCRLGFHQGDRNQQCVLFKQDDETGLMGEYARSQKCSFLIDPTTPTEIHNLRIFSINKYGDSLQNAVEMGINLIKENTVEENDRSRRTRYLLILGTASLTVLVFLLCCCWYMNVVCRCSSSRNQRKSIKDQSSMYRSRKAEKYHFANASSKNKKCTTDDDPYGYISSRKSLIPTHHHHHNCTSESVNLLTSADNSASDGNGTPDGSADGSCTALGTSSYLIPVDQMQTVAFLKSLPTTPPPVTPRSATRETLERIESILHDLPSCPPQHTPRKQRIYSHNNKKNNTMETTVTTEAAYVPHTSRSGSIQVTHC